MFGYLFYTAGIVRYNLCPSMAEAISVQPSNPARDGGTGEESDDDAFELCLPQKNPPL